MSVRLLCTLVLVAGVLAGVLAGTLAQQLLALGVAAVLLARHTLHNAHAVHPAHPVHPGNAPRTERHPVAR
jgi:hypothetical protein